MAKYASIQEFFNDYAAAFDRLDFETQADFFADNSFIMAGPKGSVSQSVEDFKQKAAVAADYYRSVGQTGARLVSMHPTLISNEYIMVKTHWAVTFKKTGDIPTEFDMTYIVYTAGPEPKIILAIAHEDEEKAMKKLGIEINRAQ